MANRVVLGGHDVPRDKIVARYTRSLELLAEAIGIADRAYIFDNSGRKLEFVAEFENGQLKQMKTATPPKWFNVHVLNKRN